MTSNLILVTGANGYIASRLIPRLLERGYRVRALARRPERLAGRSWLEAVEAVPGDVHEAAGLDAALAGVHTAYYLVHSMASGRGYTRVELEAASVFAGAAARAGVQHIVYLGGLADPHAPNLAPHMRSRIQTGESLRRGTVPVTEFRAGVIAGPGSISFEMIRYLTECFPLMPGPRWLRNKAQPIAASNVIDYLLAALDHPEARGRVYEMGGPEVMEYSQTMLRYAGQRGLKRLLFTVPGIPIALMARFVDWLTPVPFAIATPLVGGLQSDSRVLDDAALRAFPEVQLIPYHEAVRASLEDLSPARLERVWEGFGRSVVRMKHEGFFIDYRRVTIDAPPGRVFELITSFGRNGKWLYADWLWQLRGLIDRVISPPRANPGAPRRPAPGEPLQAGDEISYYSVEAVEPDRLLRLRATLRAPGDGWMEWQLDGSALKQTAFFAPRGMPGFLYWYLLAPFHRYVFRGLIRAIQRRSEQP